MIYYALKHLLNTSSLHFTFLRTLIHPVKCGTKTADFYTHENVDASNKELKNVQGKDRVPNS